MVLETLLRLTKEAAMARPNQTLQPTLVDPALVSFSRNTSLRQCAAERWRYVK